jgi:Endonuclease-reverse transcriptase
LILNIYNEKQRQPTQLTQSTQPTQPTQFTQLTQPTQQSIIYTVERLLLNFRLQQPAVIAGDFNLHHNWWNAAIGNPTQRAIQLVHWLQQQNATLLNNPEVINDLGGTFHRSNLQQTSVINLTFYTKFYKIKWGNWGYREHTGLDHEVIGFTAYLENPSYPTGSLLPAFNYRKADWALFHTNFNHPTTQYLR